MKQVINSEQSLGDFLKRVRNNKGLTQAQTGEAFQLDQTTISSIEHGAKGTRLDTLFRHLASLGLEMVIQEKKAHDDGEKW